MRHHLIAAATVLAFAAPAFAQQATTPAGLQAGQVRVKALIDRNVYSSDAIEIGEIEDIILDAQGRAVTAVIEIESRLGFTDKYVAIPYAQITMDGTNRQRATIAMTRDQLRAMPGIRYND